MVLLPLLPDLELDALELDEDELNDELDLEHKDDASDAQSKALSWSERQVESSDSKPSSTSISAATCLAAGAAAVEVSSTRSDGFRCPICLGPFLRQSGARHQ